MKPLVVSLNLKGRVNIWDLTKAAISRALDEAANRIPRELRDITPVGPYGTGTMRGSFYADRAGGGIRLIWPEPYAEAVDKGATRHTIQPKKAGGILSFPDRAGKQFGRKGKGKWAYDGRAIVQYVLNHPGQKAQHFGIRMSKAAYGIIREEIENEIARLEGFV